MRTLSEVIVESSGVHGDCLVLALGRCLGRLLPVDLHHLLVGLLLQLLQTAPVRSSVVLGHHQAIDVLQQLVWLGSFREQVGSLDSHSGLSALVLLALDLDFLYLKPIVYLPLGIQHRFGYYILGFQLLAECLLLEDLVVGIVGGLLGRVHLALQVLLQVLVATRHPRTGDGAALHQRALLGVGN